MRPILFTIGPFTVHSFGVMVLVAFLVPLWYVMRATKRAMGNRSPDEAGVITPDLMFDFCLGALFVSIVGARLLYIALDWNQFEGHWADIFKVWTGGITIIGALIVSPLYLAWFCRRHKVPFLLFADLCCPGFALGNAIGRIGCFLNGCCYGNACNLPWAVRFPDEKHPGFLTPPSHPTQIYESIMNLAAFGVLALWSSKKHRPGEIMLGFFGLYCITRTISEQFRKGATADVPYHIALPGFSFSLTDTQLFCLLALPVILLFLVRIRHTTSPRAAADVVPSSQ